jgi:hypothetical protein
MTLAFAIHFVIAALAVYRLAYMIAMEDGPFAIFSRFRLWLGRNAADRPEHGIAWTLAELFNCPHCLGIWLAFLFAPAVIWPSMITDVIIIVFALAGLQSYLTGRGEE